MPFYNNRFSRKLASVSLAVVFAATGAQAQVMQPQVTAQRSQPTAEQRQQMFAASIPMELVVTQNPLERNAAAGSDAVQPSIEGRSVSGQQFGGLDAGPGADGEPQVRAAFAGPVERVGRRYFNMQPDDSAPTEGFSAQSSGFGVPSSDISAQNYGIGNLGTIYHYSDSLVVPFPVFYEPYRSTGLYVFQAADGGTYTCTASLIDEAILVTAGHCVHDGSGTDAGWNRSGTFYPGFSNKFSFNDQRYGSCEVSSLVTTTQWYNNGEAALQDGVDVAMGLCSRLSNAGWRRNNGRLPGEALGYFGFCHTNCTQGYNFLTQLGYPSNYHLGLQMTVGQHLAETAVSGGPDYLFGSGMQGGSSGGPQVQNIGRVWDQSSDRGQNTQRNVIYAVTSWGYNNERMKMQGASPLSGPNNRNNARGMFNLVCAESRRLYGNASCELL